MRALDKLDLPEQLVHEDCHDLVVLSLVGYVVEEDLGGAIVGFSLSGIIFRWEVAV